MTIYELAKIKHLSGVRRRAFIAGAKSVLDELEMTLSVIEDAYLRSNLEKLIKELKKEEQQ